MDKGAFLALIRKEGFTPALESGQAVADAVVTPREIGTGPCW